ncbi:MAG: glucosaminidase domain-containing protein, partial [Rhodospirillales bacterium]
PALALARLPDDLGKVPEVEKRKMLFIKALLPIVLQTNERIVGDRIRLTWLRDAIAQGSVIALDDRIWLNDLGDDYGANAASVADLDELLKRVDVVPPSLAIAQAITESGWGTSYSARTGNALFGVFHFAARGGNTAVGVARPGTFQMRAYDNLSDAVDAYVANLNTHPAYKAFRDQRAKLRHAGEGLDGYALATTLLRYSELGMQYVNAVRLIMRTEKLMPLDEARLDRPEQQLF